MGRCFTVIELMISVGIVATLAAIAIPRLANMAERAKSSELSVVVDGIARTAVAAQSAGADYRTMTAYHLPAAPDPRPWSPVESNFGVAIGGLLHGFYVAEYDPTYVLGPDCFPPTPTFALYVYGLRWRRDGKFDAAYALVQERILKQGHCSAQIAVPAGT